MHGIKLIEEDWDKAETSYEKGAHMKPTGFETQTFTDMVIQNADLRLLANREIHEYTYKDDANSSP